MWEGKDLYNTKQICRGTPGRNEFESKLCEYFMARVIHMNHFFDVLKGILYYFLFGINREKKKRVISISQEKL